jgi:hypothetical protein
VNSKRAHFCLRLAFSVLRFSEFNTEDVEKSHREHRGFYGKGKELIMEKARPVRGERSR